MDPFTALMLGSTALKGVTSLISGRKSAGAAKRAALAQQIGQNNAISGIHANAREFYDNQSALGEGFQPFIQSGIDATGALDRLLANPESVRSIPGYQFLQSEGLNAIDRSGAARGMVNSGRTLKDLQRFGQGLADQSLQSQFNRLYAIGGRGLDATGQRVNTLTQANVGRLNADNQAEGLAYGGASTVPQGFLAAQNARTSGYQGALDALGAGIGQLRGTSFSNPGFSSPSFGGLY